MNKKTAIIAAALMLASAGAMAAPMHAGHGGKAAPTRQLRIFSMVDANRDGYITLGEMQQHAEQRFQRMDSNHDGKVYPQEVRQAAGKNMKNSRKSFRNGNGREQGRNERQHRFW